jgi:hypothetical protein
MYEARKFSQESYNKYNDSTINKVITHLESLGYKIIRRDETFSHDLIIQKADGPEVYVEVEASAAWEFTTRDTYKYPNVNFLGRKQKMHIEHPFMYIIVCVKTDWALACDSNVIYNTGRRKEIHVNSQFKKGSDEVFYLPKDKVSFFKLNLDGSKQTQ